MTSFVRGDRVQSARLDGDGVGVRELMAVREIAQAFLTAERPGDVFQFALDRVAPIVGSTFACIYLVDESSELMRLQAVHNWPERYAAFLGDMRVRLGSGPSGSAARERRIVDVAELLRDLAEVFPPAGIAGEVHVAGRPADHESTPQIHIAVAQRARRKMLRRNGRHANAVREPMLLPPVELRRASETLDIGLGSFNTAVLIGSSLTMAMAVWAAQVNRRKATVLFLYLCAVDVFVLAAFAILQFLWVWNDLLIALLFLGFEDPVLTVNLSQLNGRLGEGWQLLTAGAFVTMIVPMIVFFALQRFFIRGMTSGAVKG